MPYFLFVFALFGAWDLRGLPVWCIFVFLFTMLLFCLDCLCSNKCLCMIVNNENHRGMKLQFYALYVHTMNCTDNSESYVTINNLVDGITLTLSLKGEQTSSRFGHVRHITRMYYFFHKKTALNDIYVPKLVWFSVSQLNFIWWLNKGSNNYE